MINFKFDFIGITETKLKAISDPIFNINIDGYATPSYTSKGGALLYIADQFFACETLNKTEQNYVYIQYARIYFC